MGFPVLVKAALGGGGKGMKLAMQQDELEVCTHFFLCTERYALLTVYMCIPVDELGNAVRM